MIRVAKVVVVIASGENHGKAESIWDRTTHSNLSAIVDGRNADVACDSYRLWRRDIEMVRELGLDMYRFSVSWPRLLPEAFSNYVNPEAVDYYNNIINELLAHGIKPAITLYHWDLPQTLQDLGGWTNPAIVDYFADYVDVVFKLFSDRVKIWITINEPKQMCLLGYSRAKHAPQVDMPGIADYLCIKNVLLAHAKAWHLFDNKYRSKQGGLCGLTAHVQWYEPATNSIDDIQASLEASAFEQELYMHPIFSASGDYPSIVKKRVAERSQEQGYPRSRLPELTVEEIDLIKGSSDFFGANSYTSYIVNRAKVNYSQPSYDDDVNVDIVLWTPNRDKDQFWAYLRMFQHIRDEYGNPPVYIFENGCSSPDILDDEVRGKYYQRAIMAVQEAINDGCNIKSYTAWSLMDNFEWAMGYTARFGLYKVDFENENRTRTPKTSAFVYRHIVTNRFVDVNYWPSANDTMKI